MAPFDLLAALPLQVDDYELERLEFDVAPEFTRISTVIHLRGAGEEGVGEDVTYDGPDQEGLQAAGPVLPLAGKRTLGEFCELIGTLDLFPAGPERDVSRRYRRW